MPNSDFLKYPVLQVSIGGQAVTDRPAAFTLVTDRAFPSVLARLSYPARAEAGAAGDAITISLLNGDVEDLYFTGMIYAVKPQGPLRVLYLTDGYKTLCDTEVTPAYRKETAAAILTDTLDAAGITETRVTCPSVEMLHFATAAIPAADCIGLLLKALEEYGQTGLRYFFDVKDVFRFGTLEDTGTNTGSAVYDLKTGEAIVRRGDGWVETLPIPVRHSQKILIDGIETITTRTDLRVSGGRSRLRVWGTYEKR
jgi:hypothetical protein